MQLRHDSRQNQSYMFANCNQMLHKCGLTSLSLHFPSLYHFLHSSLTSLLSLYEYPPNTHFHSLPLLFLSSFHPSLCSAAPRCFFSRSVRRKKEKMNSFYPQKNACDQEMRMESLVCPKPRRYNSSITPPFSLQSEMEDSGAGADLLDIILPKGSCYQGSEQVVASPPPFWCGSPPSRASNPVIQDEQFGNGNFSPFTEPSSSSARGCAPMKFGGTPATVRIEGFDCLRRNRSSHSISAVA